MLLPFGDINTYCVHHSDYLQNKICDGSSFLIVYSISWGIKRTRGSTYLNRMAANEHGWVTGFPTDAADEQWVQGGTRHKPCHSILTA